MIFYRFQKRTLRLFWPTKLNLAEILLASNIRLALFLFVYLCRSEKGSSSCIFCICVCEDCKLDAPLSIFKGFGLRLNEARSFLLSFSSFVLFHSRKRECSPSAEWTEMFWPQVKNNYIIAKHVHTRRFSLSIVHNCSFVVVLNLDRAWPVWSGFEMKYFCCITETTIIYSVHWHDLE